MSRWILVVTATLPWATGEARYDGTFATYDEAQESFTDGMVDLGIDPWRASSPRDIGYFRRLWWTGELDGGRSVGGWEPWTKAPAAVEARVVTVREVCGEFFTAIAHAERAGAGG